MQLEAGKFYKTRDGQRVGPMRYDGHDTYPWTDDSVGIGAPCWTNDGRLFEGVPPDIVALWDEGPVRTVTRREIVPGVYGIVLAGTEKCRREGAVSIVINADANAEELREAAHLFNQLAEALGDAG